MSALLRGGLWRGGGCDARATQPESAIPNDAPLWWFSGLEAWFRGARWARACAFSDVTWGRGDFIDPGTRAPMPRNVGVGWP